MSVKVLKSTLVTFWTAVSAVLGTLVVLRGVSTRGSLVIQRGHAVP